MRSELGIILVEGFLLGLALIVGLGPQNTFILQQGIRRKYVLLVAVLASTTDALLILLGAGGAGLFFKSMPGLLQTITWLGVTFLLLYGLRSFYSAFKKPMHEPQPLANLKIHSRQSVIYSSLAVALLNPTTYLDTMIVIGGSANRYASAVKLCFTLGAVLASIVWFFSLAFGAAKLSQLLKSTLMQRLIDGFSAVLMWLIAGRLLIHVFN